MNAGDIAHALNGRKSGAGFVAKCPAHADAKPSLSLRDADGGKVLVRCFAGCEQAAVISALKALSLWPEREASFDRRVIAEYGYTDAAGNLLYQVVRFEPKGFTQRYPTAGGRWIWKKHSEQVLYRLPEVIEAAIIFLVEGEKDCETLRDYGFVATTAAGGAKAQWLPSFSETLRGREIIIVPDNDPPGWQRAAMIARALLGVASRIRILDLPADSKDISDWFAAGHSECELISMLEGVHAT